MWKSRSLEKEIIDLSKEHYSKEEYESCLVHLDRIGRWLGGDICTLNAIKKLPEKPLSILDVGCGGGLFTLRLGKLFPQAKILGIDTNEMAIEFATNALKKEKLTNVRFELKFQDELNEKEKSFDCTLTTLVCHHMKDEALIDFIQRAKKVTKQAIIINDLQRSPIAYMAFKCIAPLFFNNRLILHDGPLSIKRSFTKEEWKTLLERAGVRKDQYKLSWHPFFRWQLIIQTRSFLNAGDF